MTPLEAILREEIARDGPMTVAAWMNACLNHPQHGYYATHHPIGATGDFTTAPEISQMFGEMLAVWAASVWQAAGSPTEFALVEIGPGRGTLMADMARTLRAVPGFDPRLHLIETSPSLREEQKATLTGVSVTWHHTFDAFQAASDTPFVLIANELLDALPARQFIRDGEMWRERCVAIIDGELAFAAGMPNLSIDRREPAGTIIEIAPMREALIETVAARVRIRGGAALFIDYGSLTGGTGDTLQAVKRHRIVPPLLDSGEVDLTTHVDFAPLTALARAAGCKTGTATQAEFLTATGLLQRAGALGHASPDAQARLTGEVERLIGPDQMGELFKVLALWHPDLTDIPGFAERP